MEGDMLKWSVAILTFLLAACVGPLVPVVSLDNETALRVRKELQIYESDELQKFDYKRLGPIEATSCMNKLWDKPATREDAIDQLRYKASALGGNAITNVACEGLEGTNVAKNCWNSVTCYAAAISVGEQTKSVAPGHSTSQPKNTSGSGFIVSSQGYVITNNHVVDGCASIKVIISGTHHDSQIVRTDSVNDLALLKLTKANLHELSFRSGKKVRAGENVVVLGFPLAGLLSQEPHVTSGTLTALAGLKDDIRFLQISAPVQPGNSGGPLLDEGGNVLGIVVAKLDAVKVAQVIGDIPQNINFAINGAVVKAFLEANGVEFSATSSDLRLSVADIAEKGKKATVFIQCVRLNP